MNHQSEIDSDTDAVTETADPSGGLDQRTYATRVRLLYSGIGLTAAAIVINAAILATVYRNMIGGASCAPAAVVETD